MNGQSRWHDRAVLGTALASFASGVGQFGAVAALGDVARGFGQTAHGATIADQAGLSGTALGLGLAVIRAASLGGLPVAALADRFGRRRILLGSAASGLVLTALAALSPGYWWFVVIFAAGRPLLSGTDAVAQVSAGELTASSDRAKAVALVAAGYGLGAGVTAVIHSIGSGVIGFRAIFALALLPLAVLWPVRHWVTEPDRFTAASAGAQLRLPVFGAVERPLRRRLLVFVLLAFAVSAITGPANSFVFLYAENIIHQSGAVTALMVIAAGASGLAGLLLGRWLSDHAGRRPTATLGMATLAGCGVLAYSGSEAALVAGYVLGVLAGSTLAPAAGAMLNELFPTPARASAAGWWVAAGVVGSIAGLVLFGAIADVGNRFDLSALATFTPAAAGAGLWWLLPESRGREPEEMTPPSPSSRCRGRQDC